MFVCTSQGRDTKSGRLMTGLRHAVSRGAVPFSISSAVRHVSFPSLFGLARCFAISVMFFDLSLLSILYVTSDVVLLVCFFRFED